MKTRVISAVILLPILILILIKGGIYLALFTLIASLIGIDEFCNALKQYSSQNTKYILIFMTIIQMLSIYYGKVNMTISYMFIILFVQGLRVVFGKIKPFEAGLSLFTFFYISVSLSYIFLLSNQYPKFFWYIFIISMVTDTFAYFSGYLFGRHKLSQISPKKTVEGAIGGVIFCIIACFIYSYFFHKEMLNLIIPFAFFGSIVSQIGDIFASSFKRYMDIKDYGNIIPGHGGIMDRADSIIFTASYVYIIISSLYL